MANIAMNFKELPFLSYKIKGKGANGHLPSVSRFGIIK
jgi:hypothetical protein